MRWIQRNRDSITFTCLMVAVIAFLSLTPTQVSAEAAQETAISADGPHFDFELECEAIRSVLIEYRSPLPWWTIAYFHKSHPDFDVTGYLALTWAESSMGRDCGIATNNPTGIVWGGWREPGDPKVWYLWQSGRSGRFGIYTASDPGRSGMYWGNRAGIRAWYDLGYNEAWRTGDWSKVKRWYGSTVPGVGAWFERLQKADEAITRRFAERGVTWF